MLATLACGDQKAWTFFHSNLQHSVVSLDSPSITFPIDILTSDDDATHVDDHGDDCAPAVHTNVDDDGQSGHFYQRSVERSSRWLLNKR